MADVTSIPAVGDAAKRAWLARVLGTDALGGGLAANGGGASPQITEASFKAALAGGVGVLKAARGLPTASPAARSAADQLGQAIDRMNATAKARDFAGATAALQDAQMAARSLQSAQAGSQAGQPGGSQAESQAGPQDDAASEPSFGDGQAGSTLPSAAAAGGSQPTPAAPQPASATAQAAKVREEFSKFDAFYEAALQGTSGQFADAATAEKVARQVADKARNVSDEYIGKAHSSHDPLSPLTERDMDLNQFNTLLTDAIQGTASKYADPDKIVQAAAQIAMKAMKAPRKEMEKLNWEAAKLPQPMAADCEIVHGKLTGPKNHALCGTHGHIIDTDTKQVIAHNLDEYNKMRADPQAAPAPPVKPNEEFIKFDAFYAAALQGASGRFDDAAAAEKMAREIADKARNASDKYIGATPHSSDPLSPPTDRDMDLNRFNKFLADAIQGTASDKENTTADAVVKAAAEIAMKALKGPGKELDKLNWEAAKLPQPMGADCEIADAKPADPKNQAAKHHVICGTHGHVIDTDTKQVIAHNVGEYQKLQPDPQAGAAPKVDAGEEFIKFDAFYEAALQGTSGQFRDADEAEKVARQVADKARNASDEYIGKAHRSHDPLSPLTDRDMDLHDFNKLLADAIQGTASKYADPDKIVQAAAQIAMRAMKGPRKELDKLTWDAATLPQPMGGNCEIGHAKIAGFPKHALCETHGHIIDTESGQVVAHTLDEFKKMQGGSR